MSGDFAKFLQEKFARDYCAWVMTEGKRFSMDSVCPEDVRPCALCGGIIGPDITERPMCYRCGPYEMKPQSVRDEQEAQRQAMSDRLRRRE